MSEPTASNRDGDYRELLAWLKRQTRVLIATHTKPDGDAYGSTFAATRLLRDLGIDSAVWVADAPPYRYQGFAPDTLIVGGDVDMADYSALLCLDSARADRVELPGGRSPADFAALDVANVDHHVDNPSYAAFNLVDPTMASTCEMLARLAESQGVAIQPDTATSALIGVFSDTGGMRFSNTTPRTFRLAGWLLEQGADHDAVTRALFFCDTIEYVRLTSHVIATMKTAFAGRLAYFMLERDTLDSFGVPNADSEDLIDVIRGIRGVEIACRMQAVEGAVRFSFRSMNRDLPIIGLAHTIGGGGHAMAAGATGTGMTLAEAEQTLLRLVEELLNGPTDSN